jgi:hypothetical protein
MQLAAAAQQLGNSSGHPAVIVVSGVVLLALKVMSLAAEQEKALQNEIKRLQATVDAHTNLRQLRGEQRREFFGALNHVVETVEQASRVLPQVACEQERKLEDHRDVLHDVIGSIAKIRAESMILLAEEVAACKNLAESINANFSRDPFQEFRDSLKQAFALLEKEKEEENS